MSKRLDTKQNIGFQNRKCANGDFACFDGRKCSVCKVIAQTTPASSATSATSASSEISKMFKTVEMLDMLKDEKKPLDDMEMMFAALLSLHSMLKKEPLGRHEVDERYASRLEIEIVDTRPRGESEETEVKAASTALIRDIETFVLKSNMEKIRSLAKAARLDIQLYLKYNKVKIVDGMLWINDKLNW